MSLALATKRVLCNSKHALGLATIGIISTVEQFSYVPVISFKQHYRPNQIDKVSLNSANKVLSLISNPNKLAPLLNKEEKLVIGLIPVKFIVRKPNLDVGHKPLLPIYNKKKEK